MKNVNCEAGLVSFLELFGWCRDGDIVQIVAICVTQQIEEGVEVHGIDEGVEEKLNGKADVEEVVQVWAVNDFPK